MVGLKWLWYAMIGVILISLITVGLRWQRNNDACSRDKAIVAGLNLAIDAYEQAELDSDRRSPEEVALFRLSVEQFRSQLADMIVLPNC